MEWMATSNLRLTGGDCRLSDPLVDNMAHLSTTIWNTDDMKIYFKHLDIELTLEQQTIGSGNVTVEYLLLTN